MNRAKRERQRRHAEQIRERHNPLYKLVREDGPTSGFAKREDARARRRELAAIGITTKLMQRCESDETTMGRIVYRAIR